MSRFSHYSYFEPSKPRAVQGGIRLQSGRGKDKNWWAQRWIGVLESFSLGSRLARGRTYARQGQVLNISVSTGVATARVQGSRPKPYEVTVSVKILTGAQWTTVVEALGQQAVFAAQLLAGEMPHEIEGIFKQVGLSLFPERRVDLITSCSCPDDSNPCKHIAAVMYLLGEEFDRDPFLIFQLRGITREGLLGQLGPATSNETAAVPAYPPQPLSLDPAAFWQGGALPLGIGSDTRVPAVAAGLPIQLGPFPYWRGETPFLDTMATLYARASTAGVAVARGEKISTGRSEETD
ncbi:MAG: SWIM zinc finger family protein [Capsulimonadaceae bacterium]